ncbi:MAG TPA: glycosyltransferase family 87 protein [Anaerolineaceae bacterium]|nr:glycosyltransferase family 87 protein [Anaerolineaceae bacterium]
MRNRRALAWLSIIGGVILIGLIVLLVIGNYNYAQQNPGGNDFLVHWVGTRDFLTKGSSPYSDETALHIQTLAYGRAALPGEHELRVAYPFYSAGLFMPFALIEDYNMARAAWMTVLELALFFMTLATMRLMRWKISPLILVFFILFSIFWYHAVRPVINGNAVILIALGVVGVFLALRNDLDELAGILLAVVTIKPQVVILIVLFVLIWAFSRRRWRLITWFFGMMVLLIAVGMLFLPDWIFQNLREVMRYASYNPPGTPGQAFAVWLPATGERLGYGLSAILAVVLLLEWWLARKADFRHFLWTACLTLVVSQWIGIQTDPGNYIVCFPALALIFATWERRWHFRGSLMVFFSMLLLGVGLWMLFLGTLETGYQPQQSPVMIFPLPAFLLVGLYWVRWWALRPPTMLFEQLMEKDHPDL